jgi:hypothetical protein
MNSDGPRILRRYRLVLGLFITGLIVSGITAFPLEMETAILDRYLGVGEYVGPPSIRVEFGQWIHAIHSGVEQTYAKFPFFGYGTDWLAFGHFAIAAFFVLPFTNPTRYRGVLRVGLAACAGVIAIALISGPLRGIPLFWRLIDCSFGIFGAIPLFYCLHLLRRMENRFRL